jgi:diaminopimelate epimerase
MHVHWVIQGDCIVHIEEPHYVVPVSELKEEGVQEWVEHLEEKSWFNESCKESFMRCVTAVLPGHL